MNCMCIKFSAISSANFSETVYIVLVRSCTEIQFSFCRTILLCFAAYKYQVEKVLTFGALGSLDCSCYIQLHVSMSATWKHASLSWVRLSSDNSYYGRWIRSDADSEARAPLYSGALNVKMRVALSPRSIFISEPFTCCGLSDSDGLSVTTTSDREQLPVAAYHNSSATFLWGCCSLKDLQLIFSAFAQCSYTAKLKLLF